MFLFVYFVAFERSFKCLFQYREDQSIKQYFDEMLNKLREKIVVFDLEALLIKPVQRILKYPLLLNELIKVSIKNLIP